MSSQQAIEFWALDDIKPYEKNAKVHTEDQVEKLSIAIKTYGWSAPIVIDGDGVIIAGHGRRLAAIRLGMEKVPVICRRDLTKAEADALRLADNRTVSVEFDMPMLQEELERLADTGEIDLATMGFSDVELDFVAADLGDINTDFFVDDISGAVEDQKERNARQSETFDDTSAPIADAIGFKRVTIAQSRTLRDLMSKIEARTQKAGAEALIDFLSKSMGSAQ